MSQGTKLSKLKADLSHFRNKQSLMRQDLADLDECIDNIQAEIKVEEDRLKTNT